MLKLGHMKHKLNLSDGNSISDTANYHARFMSFSFENGYKKKIEDTIYFEPQAQLQYAHVRGSHYTTQNGIQMKNDGINSLKGRLGFKNVIIYKLISKEIY